MSDLPAFATLSDVDLRKAWKHEAHDFTPWLAQNLSRIADAIGLSSLELVDREMSVGPFSADLVARNTQDDSLVLIENQLARTDHTHLGQILTYLTGLKAQMVVWVASEFRDEHLSAVAWLNQNTIDPFAFFAVRVRVVQIADSPLAPLFEVMERPNGWDRRVQEATRELREPSQASLVRNDFWDMFRRAHPEFNANRVSTNLWIEIPNTQMVLSLFLGKAWVGLFVRGVAGVAGVTVTAELQQRAVDLQARIGQPIGNPQIPVREAPQHRRS